MKTMARNIHFIARPLCHVLGIAPCLFILYAVLTQSLGANPIEYLLETAGHWSLRFLLLSFSISPIITITGWRWLTILKRPLGLYGFFYVSTHVFIYAVFDQSLSLSWIASDIAQRPFILVGFMAWLLLIPLAMTSTKRFRKKLKKHWQTLHNLVYLILPLTLTHLLWITRADFTEVWFYSAIFMIVISIRTTKVIPRLFAKP